MPQSHISMCVGALTIILNEGRFLMKEKNNYFTHRFLLILSILFFIIFNFCIYSFGFDNSLTYKNNDKDYTINFNGDITDFKYVFLRVSSYSNGKYSAVLIFSNSPIIIKKTSDEIYKYVSKDGSDFYYYSSSTFNTLNDLNNSLSNLNKSNLNSNFKNYYPSVFSSYDIAVRDASLWTYSNSDICDEAGNVLFQKAPVTVEQVTIPKLETAQEIPQTMNKVLQMIIPIGLIVFLSGLLIYLVRLVILRMI